MASPAAAGCSLDGPPPYDLRGCDLSGRNLRGKDLTNANLQNATLLGTVFNGVTSMNGADLTGATMGAGTDFTGCDLSHTIFGPKPTFGKDPLHPTRFVGATVPFRVLGSTWDYVDLTNAVVLDLPMNLSTLTATRSNLSGFRFTNRTMTNARFFGVTLRDSDF